MNLSATSQSCLTKSDFKVARTCPTKLFYKKQKYPTTQDGDAYLELLADGGFMVGKLAQMQYPQGVLISTLDPWKAVAETQRLLQRDNVIIFEAALYNEHTMVRVDILRKRGDAFDLIEVKSKAGDSEVFRAGTLFVGTRGGIRSEWRDYLEDVCYQASVLQAIHPKARIKCFLLTPDKNKAAKLDGLCQRFRLRRQGKQVQVDVIGAEAELQKEDILCLFPVDKEVMMLTCEVQAATDQFLKGLVPTLKKLPSDIGYHCRDCEYRVEDSQTSGFKECWGKLAGEEPHVFDLYQARQAKGPGGNLLVDDLIKSGRASMFDIPEDACSSAYGARQRIQLKHTRSGSEWLGPTLKKALRGLIWPLHFVDFETSAMALPYHRGMKPFELVAFQWSCHTLTKPGTEPTHQEWINVDQAYPNIEFARSLREAIGDHGTLMTWSNHERTTMRNIAEKIEAYFPAERKLAAWLRKVTNGTRIVDMCALAKDGYFHPEMKGSLSIKYVLPAIWRNEAELRDVPWFRKYALVKTGEVQNPYSTLPPLPIGGKEELVNEGTGAMRAYQAMIYGEESSDAATKQNWKRLLLQYCELDTMAMVIIFEHWWC